MPGASFCLFTVCLPRADPGILGREGVLRLDMRFKMPLTVLVLFDDLGGFAPFAEHDLFNQILHRDERSNDHGLTIHKFSKGKRLPDEIQSSLAFPFLCLLLNRE